MTDYILSGIAPPEIRHRAASTKEWQRQTTDESHPLFGINQEREGSNRGEAPTIKSNPVGLLTQRLPYGKKGLSTFERQHQCPYIGAKELTQAALNGNASTD